MTLPATHMTPSTNNSPELGRRRFLQSTAALAAWQAIPCGLKAADDEKPRGSFVQINDVHVQAPLTAKDDGRIRTYAQANEKFQWLVEAINDGPRPDFVVCIGDLIHGERRERLALDFDEFSNLARPLKSPLYPVMGNHDVVQQEGNPEFERAYREMFGDDRVNYAFEQAGVRFVMLNNSGATSVAKPIIQARNAWLRSVLEQQSKLPTIICCHIPIVAVREEAVLAKSFGFSSYRAHDDELMKIVDDHASSVVAVLSGHLHLTGVIERKGVRHISISGTASYPSDYARYTIYANRIELEVCQLPLKLANASPSIHGKPRHPEDFTDAAHKTGQDYQQGRADERRLTIPLRG